VIVVLALSYLWQLAIFLTGGADSGLVTLLMLFPGAVAIAFRIIRREGFRNVGWGLRRWWYLIPAVLVPVVVVLGVVFLASALNWATPPDRFFVFEDGMLQSSKIGLMLGNQPQSVPFFVLNLVLSHIAFLIVGSIITLGEELGWQGYLQQKLSRRFGLNWGLVLLGVIWGYWHLPLVLMGWTFPDHPVLGALLLMPVSTICYGVFEGWIYLRSRSIWMPALAHAAINLFAGLLSCVTMHQDMLLLKLMFIAAWGIVAALCFFSLNRNEPVLWQEIKEEMGNSV
jgi:membrane protease YdiL (CAAX protease family)